MQHDTIVIGGGLIGSSAAWQLANLDTAVLLIEQQGKVYSSGSSYGDARIARYLGPEDDIWGFLHQNSLIEAQKLLDFLNSLQGERHQMEDLYVTSPCTYVFYADKAQIGGFDRVLNYRDPNCTYAFSNEETEALFNVSMPKNARALVREVKEHTGTLKPKELIRKMQLGLTKKGGAILYNTQVESIQKKGTLYEVRILNNETGVTDMLTCKNLVCAAGAYSGPLLRHIAPRFQALVQPKRVFLAFLKPSTSAWKALSAIEQQQFMDAYPNIYFTSELSYAMVEYIDSDGIPVIKIGCHFNRSEVKNMDEVWQIELDKKEIQWALDNTLAHLNDHKITFQAKDLAFHHGYSCVYAVTPSEIPFVTNILEEDKGPDPTAVILTGMSGVGAKGSMTYGLIAANLLLKKEPSEDRMMRITQEALYR